MAHTIAAVATGNSAGGIGVIRISGDEAIAVANKVFSAVDRQSLNDVSGYCAKFGSVSYEGSSYDDAVALVFRAPKSYTGEDVVEISVHGGLFIVEKTLGVVLSLGAKPAQPGEFTKRAFLNGKIDLTKAESVAEMISAQGEEAAAVAYNALAGALYDKTENVLASLLDASAQMAAWVDYPDEDIPELQSDVLENTLTETKNSLKKLLDTYDSGQVMTSGIETAIVGRPNVGKSSLMNLLSGKEKSIVTEIKGTTRDVVENTVRLGGLVLHLADTAGLRQSDDAVEAIGIERALQRIDNAALILAVFDCSDALNDEDINLINRCKGRKAVAVLNKQDLPAALNTEEIEKVFSKVVYLSAKDGHGIEDLENAIKQTMQVQNFDTSSPILANRRQKQCCQGAYDAVSEALLGLKNGLTYDAVNVMIDVAAENLLSLTGRVASEEVVNNIFSKFCVGK